jgi:hypothetical protein
MTIGLNAKELEDFFQKEYIATLQRRQVQQKDIEADLINHGIPERDAKVQAMLEVRFMAASQAMLLTILENNARIDKQLPRGGFSL